MNIFILSKRSLLIIAVLALGLFSVYLVMAQAQAGEGFYPGLDGCANEEECAEACFAEPASCMKFYSFVDSSTGVLKYRLTAEMARNAHERITNAIGILEREGGLNGCATEKECQNFCFNQDRTIKSECKNYNLDGIRFSSYTNTALLKYWQRITGVITFALENNIPPPPDHCSGSGHANCILACESAITGSPGQASEWCVKYMTDIGYYSGKDIELVNKINEISYIKDEQGQIIDYTEDGLVCGGPLMGCFFNFYGPCAYVEDPVACFAVMAKYELLPADYLEVAQKVAPFLRSGGAPGGCAYLEACESYCEDDNHFSECTEFAEKVDLGLEPPPETDELTQAIEDGEAPGGCTDEVSCRAYCEDLNNIEECLAFIEEFDLATPDELKEMRQILAAKQAGVPFPGNCNTEQSCLEYCEAPSHTVECVNFAAAAGFITGDDAAQAKKFAPLIARGETPGGCATKDQCEAYCEEGAHIEECMDFAIKYDLVPPDEIEIMKKIRPFVKAGTMPGGCKSKDECEAYCADGDHFEECLEIGLALGVIDPDEVDIIRKSGGKGPGNCRSKESCEDFCSEPENQKECMDFAVRIGLITEEEAQSYQASGDVSQCLEEADDKITACFVTNLGVEVFDQMKAGKMPYDMEIMEKMRKAQACVRQYSDQATDVLGEFLKALPAADACIAEEFGPDFIGRLRRMAIPCSQMKGIRGKMEACFQKGTNALFEECAAKDCSEVQGCMENVGKSLTGIAGQPEGGDHPEDQKQEMPQVLQDKLDSCGMNFDTKTCLDKPTCKEFFSCLNPNENEALRQDEGESSGEMPPELKERMDSCKEESIEIMKKEVQEKLDACLSLSCSEFDACMKSIQESGDEQGEQQQEQGTQDPKIEAKAQACQKEKVNACLAKSCGEFQACLTSLGGGGGGEGGTPDPAVSAKFQSCQPKKGGGGGGGGGSQPPSGDSQSPEGYQQPPSGGDQSGIPQGFSSWEAFCRANSGDSRCAAYAPQIQQQYPLLIDHSFLGAMLRYLLK